MSRKVKLNEKQSFDVIRQNDILGRPLRSLHDNFDRKCFTPSVCKSSKTKTTKKSLSKQDERRARNRSSDRNVGRPRPSEASGANLDIHDVCIPEKGKKQKLQDSAWKYKNRPSSTLANARHAKHLQFNLQNLNESVHRHEQDSVLRIKQLSFQQLDRGPHTAKQLYSLLDDGRKYLNQNKFAKAAECFKQYLQRQGFDDSETVYLLGICNFHLENYQQCIQYLSSLIHRNQEHKKNLYFFLSIAYKRVGDTEAALKILNLAIERSPKYYDALLFRGKLLSKQRKYIEAIEDFKACIKIDASKVTPYICKADCLRYMLKFQDAADLYTKALLLNPSDHIIMLKRAITYIEINRLNQAKRDLDEIIKKDPYNSEADSFRGLVFYKTRNFNDAILCYEQSIKHNSSKKAVTKSIYEIAKIRIQMRDFYGASYTLERADSLDVDKKVLEKIKLFIDGSTFLMKKKIKKGVQMLSQLIKKQNINEFIRPLAYSFRAYGYFCQCKYTHAQNDLQTLQKFGYGLDNASEYNKHLLEGIIATLNNKFEESLNKFKTADKMRPSTSDPSIYRCLTFINMHNRTNLNCSPDQSQFVNQANQAISIAIGKEDSNYNSYFIRAVIQYSLGQFQEAWNDVQKAIDKSDDHVIKHFYLRALIYAAIGKYKEALGDFSNAISLMKDLRQKQATIPQDEDVLPEKELPEAYLNRAKCYLMFGQKKRAFQDLQSYISYKPLDPQIHVLAGRLLFSIGAAEDAIKAYSNCPNIETNIPILMERAKCFLLLKQLNLCLKDMQKIVQDGDERMMFDYGCLESLRQASKNTPQNFQSALKKISAIKSCAQGDGYVFSRADYSFYKGLYYFYLKDYPTALQKFTKCLKQKQEFNCLEKLNISDIDNQDCFDNRILTFEELNYNIGIVHLMMGNLREAAKLLDFQSFQPLFKQKGTNRSSISVQPLDITPFPINNRLCSIFPALSVESNPQISFRLSFCLPKVSSPEAELHITQNQLTKLSINSTEPRPDAPWIKRNCFGVVFTQDVVGCQVDLETENQKSVQRQQQNMHGDAVRVDIENDKSMEFQGYFKDNEPEQPNRSRLKDLLTLDPQTEAKLARLLKK